MPIQPESKVFPHTVPPLPERSGNLKEDVDELYKWIFDQQKSLDELNRQVVDKYNLHIDGAQAHPKAWRYMRVRRPNYYQDTAAGTDIHVDADATNPNYYFIADQFFEQTADLTCDLTTTGPGALDTGSIAQDTAYYLYGVNNSGAVAIIASTTAPTSTGPTGYTEWTYIGAFCTDQSSTQVHPFQAGGGFYWGNDEIDAQSNAANSRAATTYDGIPVTALAVYCQLVVSGTDLQSGGGTGVDASHDTLQQNINVGTEPNYTHGWIPMFTDNTLWITNNSTNNSTQLQFQGFYEDPTRYK